MDAQKTNDAESNNVPKVDITAQSFECIFHDQ